jgi:hypothetical protein
MRPNLKVSQQLNAADNYFVPDPGCEKAKGNQEIQDAHQPNRSFIPLGKQKDSRGEKNR